jgi:hypothetical protein
MNIKKSAAAAIIPAVLIAAPAMAAGPGRLLSGPQVYKVKNMTQGSAYATSVNANCGDELQYSISLHNGGFGTLHNVNVKANLNNGSTMTADPQEGDGITGSVSATLAGNQVFENGSTVLYDENGHVIKNLSDGIASGGINVGDINGSTGEFVNFKTKVNCETPGKGAPAPTPEQPTTLPATGPEAGLAGVAGTGALGYAVVAYRRSRKALSDAIRK